jgi:hypothetical protein
VSDKDEMYRIGENGTEPPVGSAIAYRVRLGERNYDYVSVRAGNGLWYTTGGKVMQAARWDVLTGALREKGVEHYSVAVQWEKQAFR